jgi:enoyl-CoA hydratase/carnithine racemase
MPDEKPIRSLAPSIEEARPGLTDIIAAPEQSRLNAAPTDCGCHHARPEGNIGVAWQFRSKEFPMPILYEKRGHVGWLTLSRPEARNAWGEDFNEEIAQRCDAMASDPAIRVAVLTGDEAGGAFSAGANLKNPRTHAQGSMAEFIEGLPQRHRSTGQVLSEFPKPVVAAVNGYAIGIGCIVTYCCNLIIASDRAEWRLPQVALGILPNHGGIVRLARWVGKGQAMKIAMGYPMKADEAFRFGLAQWVVPHAELIAQTTAITERLAELPPLASRLAKESLNRGLDMPNVADAAYIDLYRFMALSLTEDAKESHAAWRERRRPTVRGA